MQRVLLLAILSECLGMAGTIQWVAVTGTAVSPPLDFIWAQVTYTNQPLSSARVNPWQVGERWEFGAGGGAEIDFRLTFPPLILPPDAVILSKFTVWGESDPDPISFLKTVSVSPVVDACNGEPCPYSPADFAVGSEAFARVYDYWNLAPYTLDELRTGAPFTGAWRVAFYSLDGTGILVSPGYNAVTTTRWTFQGQLGIEASLAVEYQTPDVPEPSTRWLFLAGLATVMAVRIARPYGRLRL